MAVCLNPPPGNQSAKRSAGRRDFKWQRWISLRILSGDFVVTRELHLRATWTINNKTSNTEIQILGAHNHWKSVNVSCLQNNTVAERAQHAATEHNEWNHIQKCNFMKHKMQVFRWMSQILKVHPVTEIKMADQVPSHSAVNHSSVTKLNVHEPTSPETLQKSRMAVWQWPHDPLWKIAYCAFKQTHVITMNLNVKNPSDFLSSSSSLCGSDRARHPPLPVRLVGNALPAAKAGGGRTFTPASCRPVLPGVCGLHLSVVRLFVLSLGLSQFVTGHRNWVRQV